MIRSLPSTSPVSLAKHPRVHSGPGLGDDPGRVLRVLLAEALLAHLDLDPGLQIVGGEVRVPGLEGTHLCRAAHRVAVLADARGDDVTPVGRREAEVAARDLEARRQTFNVPLPRAGERLVEVVDVEEHLAFGRREQAEVQQMRVAAELDVQAGDRSRGEVCRHDERGAPVERGGRDQHAPVADGDELGDPALGLLFEQRDRVRPVRGRLPARMARPRYIPAHGSPPRRPFLGADEDGRAGGRRRPSGTRRASSLGAVRARAFRTTADRIHVVSSPRRVPHLTRTTDTRSRADSTRAAMTSRRRAT